MVSSVFIGIGSNVGDRQVAIAHAIEEISKCDEIEVVAQSKLIETMAKGVIFQPDFLNAVIKVTTILSPLELLLKLQEIEILMGRVEKGTYGPRRIDLDIVLFGDQIVCQEELTVPHPLMHERDFVLIPLWELAPEVIHPVLMESVNSLYLRTIWGIYQGL